MGWLEYYNILNNMKTIQQSVVVPFYNSSDEKLNSLLITNLRHALRGYKQMFLSDRVVLADFCFRQGREVGRNVNVAALVQTVWQNVRGNSYRMQVDKCWCVVPKLLDGVQLSHVQHAVSSCAGRYVVDDDSAQFSGGVAVFFTGAQVAEMDEFVRFQADRIIA